MKKNLDINNIHLGDCMKLFNKIEDNTLDCVITSPPYNVDKEYGEGINDKMPHKEYLDFNRKWLKKAYNKLKVGGRICINVPTENNTGEKVYLARDFMNLCEELGFIPMANITWNKNHVTNRCAWGSWKSPSCPNIINPTEVILVYAKETRKHEGKKEDIDITKEEFIEYTMGIWTMKPASAKKLDHPAPFPDELPYRLIKLYTYKNDIVLDPFSGTGTTCKMAKKLGRRFYGFEFVEKHYKKSLERLMEE